MFKRLLIVIIAGLLLGGCTVHRLEIQQGNIIKNDQIEKLKIGISKRQVRFIMGTPLIKDPFHADRWDYVFTLQPGVERKITEYHRVTVFFEQGVLAKVDQEK